FAADDVQPARIVEIAHVTGAGHTVDDGFGATTGVVLRAQFTADEDAAGHARPDRSPVPVEDAHRAARDRSPHCFRGMSQLDRCCQSADTDLGGTVAVVKEL